MAFFFNSSRKKGNSYAGSNYSVIASLVYMLGARITITKLSK